MSCKMYLFLLNLQSNQQINLDNHNPLIIGRSNVVGVRISDHCLIPHCADKRVSRNHGKLTCTVDGKIHLVALHTNPCFFTRNGVPPILQLNKNEEETLNEGDCLGLLPDEFWFQITCRREPDVKAEKRNPDESTSETDCGEKCMTSSLQNNEMTSSENLTVKKEFNENENFVSSKMKNPSNSVNHPSVALWDASVEISREFASPELEKTRRLPLWMYEIYDADDENKSPDKRTLPSTSKQNNKKPKMSPGKLTKDKESSNSCTIKVNSKQINLSSPSTSRIPDFVDSSEEISSPKNESTQESLGGISSPIKKEGYEKCANNAIKDLSGDVLIRPICQYEDSCYRKNAQHKLEFSHPGDVDFVTYENRPLCPYGSACYRKSKKHRTEYRHPSAHSNRQPLPSSCSSRASSPLPPKRRRKTIISEETNYEGEDEYDLEDPFINDASSDEYIPSDWNSEEEKEESDFYFKDDD